MPALVSWQRIWVLRILTYSPFLPAAMTGFLHHFLTVGPFDGVCGLVAETCFFATCDFWLMWVEPDWFSGSAFGF